MEFLIGGLAGAGATVFSNPMDVVKTRFQLQGELRARNAHIPKYQNIIHAVYTIGKVDGVVALQSGLVPAMALGFALNSVRLGMYHAAEVQGWTTNKNGEIDFKKTVFWACISGAAAALVTNPAFVVKTRLQAASDPSIAVGRQHKYNGNLDAVSKIYKIEGIRGFFAGSCATLTRLSVGSTAQLTTFSTAKEALQRTNMFEESQFGLALAASCISSIIASIILCPIDVCTVRIYNQGTEKSAIVYKGIWDCFTKIYRVEGLHGFYKGLGPLFLRLAPHTTVSLVMWDMLNILMK